MPGALQLIPRGLLGFFQIRSEGRNPVDLADDLVPTVDLLNWYASTNAESFGTAPVAAAIGWNALQTSATIGWQYVPQFTVTTDALGVGDVIMYSVGMRVNPASGAARVLILSDISPAFATPDISALTSRVPIFRPPGAELGAWVYRLTGAVTLQLDGVRNLLPG